MLELIIILILSVNLLGLVLMCVFLYFLLNLITEIKMNQARIDDLTAQLNAGNENIVQTIQNESAEVQAAIANNTLDTTALEAAIAQSAELANLVEGIYNAPAETPEEETPFEIPTDEVPPEEFPNEAEDGFEETSSDSEVVTNDVSETETETTQTTDEVS